MALNISQVNSKAELLKQLQQFDIGVPKRGKGKGRKSEHAEAWTICHLLSTLAKVDRLSFPLTVEDRESPDFLLHEGDCSVGVEITEVIPEQLAWYYALSEDESCNTVLEPAHFCWNAPARQREEMVELLHQKQLTSEGFAGDRPEQEWALFMQRSVDTKLEKLSGHDFGKFDQNWLSLYDNLGLPSVDLLKAVRFLKPLLQDQWQRVPCFDMLFIECGQTIIRITQDDTEFLLLNDIWVGSADESG